MSPTVCVDIDGVLAFFLEAACSALNARFGTTYRPDAVHHYWFESWLPSEQSRWLMAQFQEPTFYRTLAPDLAGIAACTALHRCGVALWVVTDRPARVEPATTEWLAHWRVPAEQLVIGPGSKKAVTQKASLERPMVFIDDDPRKAASLPGPHVTLYLLRRPFTPPALPGGIVVDTWREILAPLGIEPMIQDVPQLSRLITR